MNRAKAFWKSPFLDLGTAAVVLSYIAALGCGDSVGTTAAKVTTQVGAALPTISLAATPNVVGPGQSSMLMWAAQNAQTVTLDPGGTVLTGNGGTVTVTPNKTTTYTLVATSAGGTQQATATVTVPPPTASLIANPATITSGQSSTLNWSTQDAVSITLNGDTLSSPRGTITVSPTRTTSYTLVATGGTGVQAANATTIVTVAAGAAAPTATFMATPSTIIAGQSSVLAWQTTHATRVSLDTIMEPTSGTLSVSPSKSSWYKLVASGPGGSVTQYAQVIVNGGAAVARVAIVVMENRNFGEVIGNTSSAPYINSLANQYGLATQYFANSIGSQPDYFMLTVGDLVYNGDNPGIIVSVDNVVRELNKAGKSWRAYAEDLPTHYLPTDPSYTCYSGEYTCIHNPFISLCDVNGASGCPVAYDPAQALNVVDYGQLATDVANANLPDYIFVIPNNCHNTHDCSLSTGDHWLSLNVPPLLSALGSNGFLVITFDESSDSSTNGGGRVPWIVAGPTVKTAYISNYSYYQHQSTLRLMMRALGVFAYPNAATTAPDMDDFFSVPLP